MYCSDKIIAFDVSYILGAVTLLTVSCVMVRNSLFSRATAFVGILTSALMFIPPSAGMAGLVHHLKRKIEKIGEYFTMVFAPMLAVVLLTTHFRQQLQLTQQK